MGARARDGGKWAYRFWVRGQLFEKSGYTSKRAALDAESERRRELLARGGAGPLLSVAIKEYLATSPVGAVTLKTVKPILDTIGERFASTTVDRLDLDDVQQYKDDLLAGGLLKGATVNRRLAYLSAFFTWAQLKRYVPPGYNPASAKVIKREREPWRSWIILSQEQREKLWASLPAEHATRGKLMFHLGVRMSVVFTLQWEQIDWSSDLITYTSKGKSGVIPVNKTARQLLETLAAEQEYPTHGPVFPVQARSTFIRWWSKARLELGLPTLRRHDLRVTFARELNSKNVDLKTIQGLLGHSSIEMTLRYIPPDLRAKREAIRALEES